MNKEITYTIEYNSNTKTWVLWKNITTDYGCNIIAVYESREKKECKNKLKELKDGKNS